MQPLATTCLGTTTSRLGTTTSRLGNRDTPLTLSVAPPPLQEKCVVTFQPDVVGAGDARLIMLVYCDQELKAEYWYELATEGLALSA